MEYVWMVAEDGMPWRMPILEEPKEPSQVEWEPVPCSASYSIRQIAASSKTAFALDRSGRILMLVLPTHIALRQKIEVYVNQRWYPLVNWRRPLPTDRSEYSDESGKVRRDLEYFEDSPVDGWSWEEPWRTNRDPRSFDDQGWQYSFTFLGANWSRQCKRQHFVRRKILRRHMRFTQHDKWIEFSPEDDSKMFVELACGGAEILDDGQIFLFALGTDGNIYRRAGISTNNPNGSEWSKLPKIQNQETNEEIDDVTLLAISPTLGTLICITWDGKMYHRKGISRDLPNGAIWRQIPTPKNRAVIGLAIGAESIWCITADGMVWFARLEIDRRRMEHTNIEELNYQEVAKSGICRISLTKNDQVFCVGSEKEVMEVRTGIDASEPSGKKFEVLQCEANQKRRWISICAASSNLSNIPKYLMDPRVLQARHEIFQFKNTFWRNQILESLQISSDKSWEIMKDVKIEKISDDFGCENVERFRKIKAQLVGQSQMRSVNLRISEAVLEIEAERTIDCAMILSSFSGFQRLPQKYLLHILVKNEAQPISFAFTDESSRNSCQEIVDNIIRSYITTSARNSMGQSMWTISNAGSVRWHCLAEMDPKFEKEIPLSDTRSLTVPGNFESIDCGANRLVWAVNFAGDLYSLHPRFDPLSTLDHTFEYRQTDELRHELYEYQKSAIFRGFVTFQGQQKGVSAWMSKSEGAAPQFYSGLASKFWTWIDAEWRLEDSDEDSWEYSNEIDGNFEIGVGKGEGKIRRRCWIRRAKFETNKSAWAKVEGPSVKMVRVAKVENQNSVTVIALTRDGHLLLRLGVNRENFTGTSWSQIVTDSPITAFHIQKNEKIWCITSESLIIWKKLDEDNSKEDQEIWNYLDMNLPSRKVVVTQKDADICGSNDILYLRSRNVLFRIDSANLTCSDPYPMENLRQAVVNLKGQICLLGSNISIVNEWKVMLYDDKKTTIIQPRSMNRAMNFGKSIISIAMY